MYLGGYTFVGDFENHSVRVAINREALLKVAKICKYKIKR